MAEPPQAQTIAPARRQPPFIQFTQLGPEGLRTARAPEEALLPQSSSRATNTLQRDPGGAILAPASSLPSRKLLPPGRPEDVPTEQLDAPNTREMPAIRQLIEAENALTAELTTPDAPETQRIPVVRPPIVDQSARPTVELPRQPQGHPEQVRQTAEQVPARSARQTEEALRQEPTITQEPQPAELTMPRRSRTERLPVPKATDENIGQLRARQEELGRLAYDRRGAFTGDLRDEYNQLTAHIRDYDNEQAKIARGGRLDDSPPPARLPERMTPPPEEREARRAALAAKPEAETGRRIQHFRHGLVTEAADQRGAPTGKLRVIDTEGNPHLIQNPRTRGNREAAFVKPSTGSIPAEAMPELRAPGAPPSPLAGKQTPSRGQRSYAIPEEAMPELRDRPKPQFVVEAERRLKDAASGKLAGSGGRQLLDAAVVTGWKVYEAGMDFARWSAEVVKQAGEQVRPHLRAAWDRINRSFSVGALPGETKGGTILGTAFGGLQGGLKGKAAKTTPAGDDLTARERLGRKIGTAQTMAQLLNPKTIAQNVIGNAAFSGAKNAATFAAIPVDKFLSLVTKQRQVSTPELRTQFNDFVDGFTDMYHAIKSDDYAALADNRYELNNERVFKGKVGGFFEDVLNIALRAPDRGAYLAAYNDSVQQILKAQAKSKSKFSLDQIHEQAKVEAQQAVFQDSNIISDFTVGLRNLLNKVTPFGEKANFGLGDLVGLKYARTPANLVARGIEYSPAGFVNAFYKTGKVLAGKGSAFDQRAAALAFGKAFVGSAFGSGMGALLYEMGIITQPEQENRGVQAAERGEGLMGYQLNLSALKRYASGGLLDGKFGAGKKQAGDVLMSYDWLQPWAFSVGMGAAARKAAKNRKADADTLNDTLTQIDAVTSTLTDQSILRNIRDIGRYGLKSTARKVATDAPASFVPAVLNQARTIIDGRAREISKEKGGGGMGREALDKVLNKLPGASKRLPERKDVIGRDVPSRLPGKTGAALATVPGRFGEFKPHPLLSEMQETGAGTTGVSRKEGETEGQFRARRAMAAEWRRGYGLRLTTSKAYREATPEERKTAIEHLNKQIAGQSDERHPKLYLFAPAKVMESALKSEREKRRKAEAAASALQ